MWEEGIVARLRADRGFGFIRSDAPGELFFHASQTAAFNDLRTGQRVRFRVDGSPVKGPRAIDVQAIEG